MRTAALSIAFLILVLLEQIVQDRRGPRRPIAPCCKLCLMRMRGVVATLMAFVLLSVTCVASACEMSCNLKMAGSGCEHTASRHSLSSQSVHNMSPDNMAATPKADSVQSTSCDRAVCEHHPQALANEKNSSATQVLSLQQIFLLATFASPPLEQSVSRVSETPPLRSDLLVFLQTTLRV
jgi:hypothetical protein